MVYDGVAKGLIAFREGDNRQSQGFQRCLVGSAPTEELRNHSVSGQVNRLPVECVVLGFDDSNNN